VTSGPWRTRAARPWHEWLVALLFAVWPIWILDPASRIGGFYVGKIFRYAGPGFWFGLPLGSQIGYTVVSAIVLAVLFRMTADEPDRAVPDGLARHPHLIALTTWNVQFFHLAIAAIWVGASTLGGSAFLIWAPGAAMTAVLWSHLRPVPAPAAAAAQDPARVTVG
jgi:hypothetical protein